MERYKKPEFTFDDVVFYEDGSAICVGHIIAFYYDKPNETWMYGVKFQQGYASVDVLEKDAIPQEELFLINDDRLFL